MNDTGWDGTERRSTDDRLASAISEVRALRAAAAKLADAVEVRTDEFRQVVVRVGMMIAALLLVLLIFSRWEVNRLTNQLSDGQATLTCLLLVEPVARTAQSLIDCQRG